MSTTLHPRSHLLHQILTISCIMCMGFSMIGCRVFHEEAFRQNVVLEQRDSLPTEPVQPGYSFRTLDSVESGDLVVVSYQDTTPAARIITAEYDREQTTDTSLALRKVRDTIVPRTLSVAFRNVQQVYPVKRYPSYITTDPGKTLVWILFGLPALAIGGMLLGLALAAVVQLDGSEGESSSYAGLGSYIGNGGLGLLTGIITWVALTIPIR